MRVDFSSLFAGRGFMMQKHRFTVAHNFVPEITDSKAKIDIPKGYGERLIEAADLIKTSRLVMRHAAVTALKPLVTRSG